MSIPCPQCQREFRNEHGMLCHFGRAHVPHRTKPEPEYRASALFRACPDCSFACNSQTRINEHIRLVHRRGRRLA